MTLVDIAVFSATDSTAFEDSDAAFKVFKVVTDHPSKPFFHPTFSFGCKTSWRIKNGAILVFSYKKRFVTVDLGRIKDSM